jgi:hypothetical protein
MLEKFLRKHKCLLLSNFIWILLWLIPWGKLTTGEGNLFLIFFEDMTKLLVALGMFVLPGALVYLLVLPVEHKIQNLFEIIPIGFSLSVTLIAVIGLFGRFAELPFILVKFIFMLLGVLGMIVLSFRNPILFITKRNISSSLQNIFSNVPLFFAFVLAATMVFHGFLFFIDDTSYGAYIISWQNSTSLGFENIVHYENVVEDQRFWLALYPMGQALLSDLSGVPGILLLSNYIELFLVPIAVAAAYWFARVLGLSRRAAGFSVFIQIIFYIWMISEAWPVGFWFFLNLSEDKVSAVFLLAPMFIAFALKYFYNQKTNYLILAVLLGIGIMLTHPVILFLACVIVAGLGIISYQSGKINLFNYMKILLLLAMVLLPYLLIRLSNHPSQQSTPYDAQSVKTTFQAERYTNIVNDMFYGLNPEVLKFIDISQQAPFYSTYQIFRWLPVFLVLISGLISFKKLKEGVLYWYIFVCVILVTFAAIPFTGWILGYFISSRMLPRVSWFSPLGLSGVVVLGTILNRLKSNSFVLSQTRKSITPLMGLTLSTVLAVVMLFALVIPRAKLYFEVLNSYRQIAQLGSYIDANTKEPVTVIALDYWTTQLLPSASSHADLISFREEKDINPHNYFLTADEIHQRKNASDTIISLEASTSLEDRCRYIDEYKVRFVLSARDNATLYSSIVALCGKDPVIASETDDMILIELK